LLLVIAALLALWVTLLGLALAGSMWQVPVLKQLSRKPWPVRICFFANSILLILVPVCYCSRNMGDDIDEKDC
jgi:hypothetical protein